jgi:hypothetical protein
VSHASSDGVMDVVRACPDRIQFRFGLEFRIPNRPRAAAASPLPARYLRIQAAWPPPRRVDGSSWQDGLFVDGGRPFRAADMGWRDAGVFPLEGNPPLDQPRPDTVILDRWLAVPEVPPTAAATAAIFDLTLPGQRGKTNHFLSVPYAPPTVNGQDVAVTGVTYFCRKALPWTRPLNQRNKDPERNYVAVSFDRFWPPERASADYIIVIEDCAEPQFHPDEDGLLPWPANPW